MFIKRMREKRKEKKREAEQEARQQLIEATGLSFSEEVKGERESFAFMKFVCTHFFLSSGSKYAYCNRGDPVFQSVVFLYVCQSEAETDGVCVDPDRKLCSGK